MTDSANPLVCTYWGQQHAPSRPFLCSECGEAVAINETNLPLHPALRPICPKCYLRVATTPHHDGVLLAGVPIAFVVNRDVLRAVCERLVKAHESASN